MAFLRPCLVCLPASCSVSVLVVDPQVAAVKKTSWPAARKAAKRQRLFNQQAHSPTGRAQQQVDLCHVREMRTACQASVEGTRCAGSLVRPGACVDTALNGCSRVFRKFCCDHDC